MSRDRIFVFLARTTTTCDCHLNGNWFYGVLVPPGPSFTTSPIGCSGCLIVTPKVDTLPPRPPFLSVRYFPWPLEKPLVLKVNPSKSGSPWKRERFLAEYNSPKIFYIFPRNSETSFPIFAIQHLTGHFRLLRGESFQLSGEKFLLLKRIDVTSTIITISLVHSTNHASYWLKWKLRARPLINQLRNVNKTFN